MIALLAVAVLAAAPGCAQDTSQPQCVTVPTVEAAAALECVAADLPACMADRHADAQICDVDRAEAADRFGAAVERGDRLARLLAEVPAPPIVPWYSSPEFVAPAAVGATLAALMWAGRI